MVVSRVQTFMQTVNTNQRWKQAFNQVCFFNYDVNNSVTINEFVLKPATTAGPTFFEISLNQGEINDTYFDIKFVSGSVTNHLLIVHTLYNHGLTEATT